MIGQKNLNNKIRDIIVLGGGTAGLISALILKVRFSNIKVTIIKSDKIGIIGVGEGSTEHFKLFCDFIGVSLEEFIYETNATFKYGIKFKNWTKKDYIHFTEKDLTVKLGDYFASYANLISKNKKNFEYINSNIWSNNVVDDLTPNQIHFNTFKLNNFLLKKCKDFNIKIINDEIVDVKIKGNSINTLIGKNKKYKSDFYIDSSGFKKILINKLGAKWISYKKYLPMNEAIAFQTEDTDDYPVTTLSQAMKYGWMWRIPTYGRWGNGYVFDNSYINADEAKKEVEKTLNIKINIGKNIKFDPGGLDRVWIGNCVAIGLSANFIEPLEASSIGTSINQSFLLIHNIMNYNKNTIDNYNTNVNEILNNIRDFVCLHYLVNKKDSKFWKDLHKKILIPESLKNFINEYTHKLPIDGCFKNNYLLFGPLNFLIVMDALELFDNKSIKNEYENVSNPLKNIVENHLKNYFENNKSKMLISHKKYLTILRGKYDDNDI